MSEEGQKKATIERFTSGVQGEKLSRLGDLGQLYPPGYTPPTLLESAKEAQIHEAELVVDACNDVAAWAEHNGSLRGTRMTKEDAASIALYTFDFGESERESNPYRVVNNALFDRSSLRLRRLRAVLWRLLFGLRSLPRFTSRVLYRGIKDRVALDDSHYHEGNKITWHTFASTTTDLKVTKTFLTDPTTGVTSGTLFAIHGDPWGYELSPFSHFPGEKEILIEPEMDFKVVGVLNGPLIVIDLEMLPTPLLLEKFIPSAFAVSPPSKDKSVVSLSTFSQPQSSSSSSSLTGFEAEVTAGVSAVPTIVDRLTSNIASIEIVKSACNAFGKLVKTDRESLIPFLSFARSF